MPKQPNLVTVKALSDEPTEMEATPGQAEEASSAPAEPSLAEIKEMLVDIKIDVCSLLRENEAMKNNMMS